MGHWGQGAPCSTSMKHNGGHSAGCGVKLCAGAYLPETLHIRCQPWAGCPSRFWLGIGGVLLYSASAAMPLVDGLAARKPPLVCDLCGLNAIVRVSMMPRLLNVPLVCVCSGYS